MEKILLPGPNGKLAAYSPGEPNPHILSAHRGESADPGTKTEHTRLFYSAAHVVADPYANNDDPWDSANLDWDATLAYREYLWSLGLGIAEAMDTAQRGMGLDWDTALELIRRSAAAAKARSAPVLLASGVGTDHLAPSPELNLDQVIAAYKLQCEAVEAAGSRIILMASRALAACAKGPEDYATVYDSVLSDVAEPVILHWLGEMFDPALAGYWGHREDSQAMEVALDVIRRHADKIDGIKISLLSAEKEVTMRRLLPAGVVMYTGDDFNYPELIAGDEHGYSDALLGIFDPIAPAATAALTSIQQGDSDRFFEILNPTVPLSRHIFRAPTRYYKTGVVFMAYLNGHQDHFTMVGGQQSARSLTHLVDLFKLADQAGLLLQPDLACQRMKAFLTVHGAGE